jgi:hypothetical protein
VFLQRLFFAVGFFSIVLEVKELISARFDAEANVG